MDSDNTKTIFGIQLSVETGEGVDVLNAFRRKSLGQSCLVNAAGNIIAVNIRNNTVLKSVVVDDQLAGLQYLNLSDNENLTELVFEAQLPALFHLDISDSKVRTLRFNKPFPELKWLDAARNDLKTVFFENDLPAIEYLDLSGNQLTEIDLPTGFGSLKYLYLNKNSLTSFTSSSSFPSLEILHLESNQLVELPNANYDKLETLYVKGNPLKNFAENLIKGDDSGNASEIIGMLRAAAESGESPNYHVQLILLGNGRIGKTCLIERLAGAEKCPERLVFDYTHGISITELDKDQFLPEVKITEDLHLKVWDFGGQEIFYASHQFFLSEEAAYIYVWTTKEIAKANKEKARQVLKQQGKILPEQEYDKMRSHEYWLDNIRMHGKDSPVLVVKTHCRDSKAKAESFPNERLKETFGFKRNSLDFDAQSENPEYLTDLKEALASIITSLPLWGAPFPNSYLKAKKILAKLKKDGISELDKHEFIEKVVKEAEVKQDDTDKLLGYLRKTGEIIYFPSAKQQKKEAGDDNDTISLDNRIFINPETLTGKIYQLIEDHQGLTQRKGVFDQTYAQEKLGDDWKALLKLLQLFELIFKKESEGKIQYIAPQYLDRNAEVSKLVRFKTTLLFELKYPRFLPENVMINVLSHYGPYATDEVYQNSISFIEESTVTLCVIDVDFEQKLIKVSTEKSDKAPEVGKAVYEKFMNLSKKAEIHMSVDGQHWVSTKGLQKDIQNGRDIKDVEENWLDDTEGFEFLKEKMEHRGSLVAEEVIPVIKSEDKANAMEVIKSEIKNLVAKARVKQAIELLIANLEGNYQNEAIKLMSDQEKLDRDVRMNIISNQEANIEQSKITNAVLNLVNYIGSEVNKKQPVIPSPDNPPKVEPEPEKIIIEPIKKNMEAKNKTLITGGVIAVVIIVLLALLDYSGKINIFGLGVEVNKNPEDKTEQQITTIEEQDFSVIGKVFVNRRLASNEVTFVSVKGDNLVNPVTLTSSKFELENVRIPENGLLKIAITFNSGFEESAMFNVANLKRAGIVDVGEVHVQYTEPPASSPNQRPVINIINKNITQISTNDNSDSSGNQQINE